MKAMQYKIFKTQSMSRDDTQVSCVFFIFQSEFSFILFLFLFGTNDRIFIIFTHSKCV